MPQYLYKWLFVILLSLSFPALADCGENGCCENMGGINYCDSSAGRYVCNNGYFSSCYCEIHAVMDIQGIQGCCIWHGGVYPVLNPYGVIICRDGTIAELCSIQSQNTETYSTIPSP